MVIILLIILAVLIFLIWVEVIPLRKLFYAARIKAIGIKLRCLVELLDCLDRAEKWIDRL